MGRKAFAIPDEEIANLSQKELVDIFLPLVKSIANQVISKCPANVELDDLINVGVIGLMDAAERFSPEYGKPFRFYAELRIRGEILDELRHNDWVPRSTRKKFAMIDKARQRLERERGPGVSDRDIAEELGLNLDRYHRYAGKIQSGTFMSIEDLKANDDDSKDLLEVFRGNEPDPDETYRRHEMWANIRAAIEELPPREQLMISQYYFNDKSLKQIGSVLGVTESRVSQMHTKALSRLRKSVARLTMDSV